MITSVFSFEHLGPMFVGMIVLILLCMFAGHWVGKKIGQGVQSGFGVFLLVWLVSASIVGLIRGRNKCIG